MNRFIKTLNDIGYEYIGYKHKEFSFKKNHLIKVSVSLFML